MTPSGPQRPADDAPRYRPLSRRRRLLLVLLALATALVVLWLMLQPQLRAQRAAVERRTAPVAPPAPCAPGQTEGCVGGTMGVIVPASAARP